MNLERLSTLYKHVQQLPADSPIGFDMYSYYTPGEEDCGTTACLAGWTVLLFGSKEQQRLLKAAHTSAVFFKYGATELLDLHKNQANNLFLDFSENSDVAISYLGHIVETSKWCTPDEYLEYRDLQYEGKA